MAVFDAGALVSDSSPRYPERRAISALMVVFIVMKIAVGRWGARQVDSKRGEVMRWSKERPPLIASQGGSFEAPLRRSHSEGSAFIISGQWMDVISRCIAHINTVGRHTRTDSGASVTAVQL